MDKYALEISALRLGMPPEVLRNVKSTVVPTMSTDPDDADADKQYSGYPWVWQHFILSHYSGQDTVLAERMTFLDTCKQRLHESVAEFEAHCKYHGLRCEYRHMANPEEELMRDRFVTGVRDDKLRAELLRHKKDDGSVFTLTEVVNRAKSWEAAMLTNAKVMEAQSMDKQVHNSSSGATASCGRNQHGARHHGDRDRATATDRRHSSSGWTCWHCEKQCPASKPGVVCSHCLGRNHFAVVCRRISSRKPIKGDISAPTRANRFTHWIMQCCQRRSTVVTIFITSPWMSQSMLCHQLLLSCSPRSLFRCLAILSRRSSFKHGDLGLSMRKILKRIAKSQ